MIFLTNITEIGRYWHRKHNGKKKTLHSSQKLTHNSHRSKLKMQNYKTPRDNVRQNLDDLGYGNNFLVTTTKAWSMKQIIDLWMGT